MQRYNTCFAGSSSSAAVDNSKLTKRVDLIQRYLDHTDTLELQALYALQALVHKLEHPPGKCGICLASFVVQYLLYVFQNQMI